MKNEIDSIVQTPSSTHFAPAGRADMDHVRKLNVLIESEPHIKALIDAMPLVVVILNHHRQIVAANEKLCSLLGVDIEDALGRRPGELIRCIHAAKGPNGCGTDQHCRLCGAINTVLRCMDSGKKVAGEWKIYRTRIDFLWPNRQVGSPREF